MASSRSDLERRSQAYRLIGAYSLRPAPPYLAAPPPLPPTQTLTADAQVARSLVGQPPGPGPESFDAATAVAAGDLMLNLLAPPLIAVCDAARSSSCIAPVARDIRESLLDAYARTAVLWGEEGYDHRGEDQYAVAEALLTAAAAEPGLLTTFIAGFAGQARALSETLRAMTVAATYSVGARASLRSTWPAIISTAERWSQWAKRDWAAYVAERSASS